MWLSTVILFIASHAWFIKLRRLALENLISNKWNLLNFANHKQNWTKLFFIDKDLESMSTRNNISGAIDKKLCQPSKLTSSLCKYGNNSAIKVHRTMQAKNPRNFHAPLFNDVVITTTASHLLAEFCTDKCQNDERSYHEYPNSRINFYDQWEHVNSCLNKERSCHERTFPTFPETSRSFAPFPWTSRVVL